MNLYLLLVLQWLPLKKHRPSETICITYLFWSQLSTLEPNSSELIWRSPQPPFIERRLVVLALRVALHVENFDADMIVSLRNPRGGKAQDVCKGIRIYDDTESMGCRACHLERRVSGVNVKVGQVIALLFDPSLKMLLDNGRRCAFECDTIVDDFVFHSLP